MEEIGATNPEYHAIARFIHSFARQIVLSLSRIVDLKLIEMHYKFCIRSILFLSIKNRLRATWYNLGSSASYIATCICQFIYLIHNRDNF